MARTVWDALAEQANALVELQAGHEALQGRVERMFRKGKVTDVDATNQKYRQEIGLDDQGNSVKSPWVRYAQFAGDRRIHSPPFVGQQMLLISPDGDHEQAHGVPLTFSDDKPSPSDKADEHVDAWGKSKDTLKDGNRKIEVNNCSIEWQDGKLVITATDIVLAGSIKLGSADASRELALKDSIDSAGDVEQSNLSTKVKAV